MINLNPEDRELLKQLLQNRYDSEFDKTIQHSVGIYHFDSPFLNSAKCVLGTEIQRNLACWSLRNLNMHNNQITPTYEMLKHLLNPAHVLMFHLEVAVPASVALLDDELDAMIFMHLAQNLVSEQMRSRCAMGVVHRQSFESIDGMRVYIVPGTIKKQVTLLHLFGKYYQRDYLDRVFFEFPVSHMSVCTHCGRIESIAFFNDEGDMYCEKCVQVL